jgi:DNA-binding CsgD family transcriptional regulator
MAIIERQDLRGQLGRQLDRVGRGSAVMLAVTGPAPGGKTAILRAIAADHEDWLVLWASCLPLGAPMPYGVIYQWFAGLGRVSDEGREPFDGPGAALLDLVSRGAVDTEAAEISWAVRWVVARLAARQRVLLVVDDLQWADEASATVIGHMVSLLSPEPIALLCGIRDELPATPIVEAILHTASVVSLRRPSLTPAERRVAELAVSGLSNRDIAARLFVTVKTVEFHLSRVYRKLGARARGDLAAHIAADPAT